MDSAPVWDNFSWHGDNSNRARKRWYDRLITSIHGHLAPKELAHAKDIKILDQDFFLVLLFWPRLVPQISTTKQHALAPQPYVTCTMDERGPPEKHGPCAACYRLYMVQILRLGRVTVFNYNLKYM